MAKSKLSIVSQVLLSQVAVVSSVLAVGVWQHEFVIHSAMADIYVFALLFSAAAFGLFCAFRNIWGLRTEFLALDAMREVHRDARDVASGLGDEVHRRRMSRIQQKSVVYNTPSVLGTAHNLLIEGIRRDGALQLTAATMQVLLTDVETKLEERQAMAHYLGALLVLLGLLGTFIGLMHTLESVGGILGSLDLSGNGGTNAIASLIESLKRPLNGMATGFGASLFGLIGSLVIGVLSKLDSKAAKKLNHDFETWLRSSVQIEGTAGQSQQQSGAGTEMSPAFAGMALRALLSTSNQLPDHIEVLARNAERLALINAEQQQAWIALKAEMGNTAQAQMLASRSLAAVGSSVSEMPDRVEAALHRMELRMLDEIKISRDQYIDLFDEFVAALGRQKSATDGADTPPVGEHPGAGRVAARVPVRPDADLGADKELQGLLKEIDTFLGTTGKVRA